MSSLTGGEGGEATSSLSSDAKEQKDYVDKYYKLKHIYWDLQKVRLWPLQSSSS